jgi:hypothetical protein
MPRDTPRTAPASWWVVGRDLPSRQIGCAGAGGNGVAGRRWLMLIGVSDDGALGAQVDGAVVGGHAGFVAQLVYEFDVVAAIGSGTQHYFCQRNDPS